MTLNIKDAQWASLSINAGRCKMCQHTGDAVKKIMADEFFIAEEHSHDDSKLIDSLGPDEEDFYESLLAVEARFGFEFSDDEMENAQSMTFGQLVDIIASKAPATICSP